jgi:hypothetical protein
VFDIQAKLPVFTLPFTLSTLVMILSWMGQGQKWAVASPGINKDEDGHMDNNGNDAIDTSLVINEI